MEDKKEPLDELQEIKDKDYGNMDYGDSQWWFNDVADDIEWLIKEVERLRQASVIQRDA